MIICIYMRISLSVWLNHLSFKYSFFRRIMLKVCFHLSCCFRLLATKSRCGVPCLICGVPSVGTYIMTNFYQHHQVCNIGHSFSKSFELHIWRRAPFLRLRVSVLATTAFSSGSREGEQNLKEQISHINNQSSWGLVEVLAFCSTTLNRIIFIN